MKNSPLSSKFEAILAESIKDGEFYTSFDTFASFVQAFDRESDINSKLPYVLKIFGNLERERSGLNFKKNYSFITLNL